MCAKKSGRKHTKKDSSAVRNAGSASQVLSALPCMENLPGFENIPLEPFQQEAFDQAVDSLTCSGLADVRELALGCVVSLDRGFPVLESTARVGRAEFSAQLSKEGVKLAVGDWACVRYPEGHDKAQVMQALPRRSEVARWGGKKRGQKQVLAANLDKVLIVQPLGERTFLSGRIVRSCVVALDCQTRPVVVLTKADLCRSTGEMVQAVQELRDILEDRVEIIVCGDFPASSDFERANDVPAAEEEPEAEEAGDVPGGFEKAQKAHEKEAAMKQAAQKLGCVWGALAVVESVPQGCVAMVLGESGAGKSTLLNSILGAQVLQTGAVRSKDGAGRHTTVGRRMVQLPNAGIIIDEPGLRSLPVLGHMEGLELAFPAIVAHGGQCKFSDCTHTHEPGCALLEGLEQQEFTQAALDSYLSLAQEMREAQATLDPDVSL